MGVHESQSLLWERMVFQVISCRTYSTHSAYHLLLLLLYLLDNVQYMMYVSVRYIIDSTLPSYQSVPFVCVFVQYMSECQYRVIDRLID